ncbi:DUF4369 domain-containing protein [Cellulophaga sp. F20128]|uniref:DUF4369 domain-containing protein n=1 Tax=Cellulophaga sp. F20128 TaxID=2926413 RepID=UPI001FF6DF3E|nr:DUF4369 domain-containing protein [Cellulophaga sp. F20128]MCK0158241.1 DUF4369 domain-containing protein [Cellulophaga sp. F20128]
MLILFVSIITSITTRNYNEKKKGNFIIYGQVTGFPDGTKFYLRNLATDAVFDSAIVKNNTYKFEGNLESPSVQIWLNTILDKNFYYTYLLIGNENITVKGDISDLPWNVNISGSKTQGDFNYS